MGRRYRQEPQRQGLFFLLGINVIMYAVMLSKGITNATLIDYGGMYSVGINATGEYWRLITAGFLHAGPMHLLMNMMSLYIVGQLLEPLLGTWRFLTVYVSAIFMGNLASYAFGLSNSISVGASSGIFGLFGIVVFLSKIFPRNAAMKVNARQYMFIIAINVLFGLGGSSVDHFAHFGGLIGGLMMGYSLSLTKYQRGKRLLLAVLYGVLCVMLLVFGRANMSF